MGSSATWALSAPASLAEPAPPAVAGAPAESAVRSGRPPSPTGWAPLSAVGGDIT